VSAFIEFSDEGCDVFEGIGHSFKLSNEVQISSVSAMVINQLQISCCDLDEGNPSCLPFQTAG
jgi:hypothetical protein